MRAYRYYIGWVVIALATDLASAASITVNTATDDFGSVGSNCSLREAIQSANGDADFGGCTHTGVYGAGITDVVVLPAITVTLTRIGTDDNNSSGDLDIASNMIIDGAGSTTSVIRGDTSDPDSDRHRLVHVISGSAVLNDLRLRDGLEDGSTAGGGLRSEPGSTTTLNRVTVTASIADGNAGGILNRGTMTLNESLVSNNRTRDASEGGGGIFVSPGAVMTINDSRVLNNSVDGGTVSFGGGIYNAGTLALDNSVVDGNLADGRQVVGDVTAAGGGLYSIGNFTAIQSTFSNNAARSGSEGASGGGIKVDDGIFALDLAVITGNLAISEQLGGDGGGLMDAFLLAINGVIRDSVISNNEVAGGGVLFDSAGGGLFLIESDLVRSTVSNNRALGQGRGGGILLCREVEVVDSTIIGNSAEGDGGGIFAGTCTTTSTAKIRSSSILGNIGNSDDNNTGSTGGLFQAGLVEINNTVIAGNLSGVVEDDCGGSGSILSAGYNLVQGNCNLQLAIGDRENIAAQLAVATNNGGPTAGSSLGIISGMPTRSPLPTSPLIDAGDPAGCRGADNVVLAIDQIGRPRAIDGPDANTTATCDIGAIEFSDPVFADGFE